MASLYPTQGKRMSFRLQQHEHDRCVKVLQYLGYGWDFSRLIRQSLKNFCSKIEAQMASDQAAVEQYGKMKTRKEGAK